MKNRILALMLCLLMLLLPVGCDTPTTDSGEETTVPTTENVYTFPVNFYVDGQLYDTQFLQSGERVSTPMAPQKENYIFLGWYVSESSDQVHDFSLPLYGSYNLYARFKIDAESLTNQITSDTMRSIVTVRVTRYKHYKIFGLDTGIKKSEASTHGSGVVLNIADSYVYVLTNCHVAYFKDGYDSMDLWIEDHKGNRYEAHLYTNKNKAGDAISAEYDLAFLYAKISGDHNFKELPLADCDAIEGESVISVGTPDGQKNAIGFGEVMQYRTISLDNTPTNASNVTFPVINHNAYTMPGSSGGALLNARLELVGIHYAAQKDNAHMGYAIPLSKIREFLNTYAYN